MPAARSFKAENAERRQLGLIPHLHSLVGHEESVTAQILLHFTERSLAVIPKLAAHFIGSDTRKHCKHSLSALEVGRLVYIYRKPCFRSR